MNERIKLLAEQAGFTEGGYESDDGPWIGPEFDKEKFAELIVKECDRYVAEQYDECEPWMQPGDLLKHFGVKE